MNFCFLGLTEIDQRCFAPLNMTVPNRLKLYGALALGVRACFTSSFGFLPSSDIR
jgi:hypothetical protein